MWGFIVAVIAGFLVPHLESPVARPVEKAMQSHVPLAAGELRLLAFVLAMLAAGVVAELLNSGSAFWVILGGALGYFGARILAALRKVIDARRT
jgi:hypothetical protein